MRKETSENDFRNLTSDEFDRYLRQTPDSSTDELQFLARTRHFGSRVIIYGRNSRTK